MGTPLYMAPELVRHEKYTEKIDVWSLGVVVYQLLCGKTPFDGVSLRRINHNICNKEVNFNSLTQISEEAKSFILHCLEKDPHKRPSIKELFDDAWIQNIADQDGNENSDQVRVNLQNNIANYQQSSQL